MTNVRRCPECGCEFTPKTSCCFCSPCQDSYACPQCGMMLREPMRIVLSHNWDEE